MILRQTEFKEFSLRVDVFRDSKEAKENLTIFTTFHWIVYTSNVHPLDQVTLFGEDYPRVEHIQML